MEVWVEKGFSWRNGACYICVVQLVLLLLNVWMNGAEMGFLWMNVVVSGGMAFQVMNSRTGRRDPDPGSSQPGTCINFIHPNLKHMNPSLVNTLLHLSKLHSSILKSSKLHSSALDSTRYHSSTLHSSKPQWFTHPHLTQPGITHPPISLVHLHSSTLHSSKPKSLFIHT